MRSSTLHIYILIVLAIAILVCIGIADYRKRKVSIISDIKGALKGILIFVIPAIILTIVGICYKRQNKSELLANKGMAIGLIYEYHTGAKSSDYFNYRFSAYGSIFYGQHIGTWPNGGTDKFIGRQFPIIFDSLNPNNQRLLVTPADFNYYGIPFPDSLKWVLPYYDKSITH